MQHFNTTPLGEMQSGEMQFGEMQLSQKLNCIKMIILFNQEIIKLYYFLDF